MAKSRYLTRNDNQSKKYKRAIERLDIRLLSATTEAEKRLIKELKIFYADVSKLFQERKRHHINNELRQLKMRLMRETARLAKQYSADIAEELQGLLEEDSVRYAKALQAVGGFTKATRRAGREIIVSKIQNIPAKGLGLAMQDIMDSIEGFLTKSEIKAINDMFLEGLEPQEIAERMQAEKRWFISDNGELKKKVKVPNMPTQKLRSATQGIISIGRELERVEVEKDYLEHIKGWLWDAHMDSHTTHICMQRDGKFYSKKDYASRDILAEKGNIFVPRHWGCRSVLIPIPYSDKD